MLILFVEDDRALAANTIDFLNNEGIEVDFADSVHAAKEISSKQEYDAIVLDIGLPDGTGFVLATHFTAAQPDTPIIFLTAEAALDNKLLAFSLGALDYLTKPFELAELTIRLKLLEAKKPSIRSKPFVLGDLTIDLQQRIATRSKRVITLSPQQWLLLTLLINHYPAPVSKAIILEKLWPDNNVTTAMYKTLVSRLRNNISHQQETPLLHTIKGVGVVLREAN